MDKVNCCAPRFILPVPDRLVIVEPFVLLISSVPVTLTCELLAIEPLPLNAKEPPLMLVKPVYVFTPDKVSVPAFNAKLPVPLITPLKLPLALLKVNCCAPKEVLPVPVKLVIVVPFVPLILKVPLFATPLEIAILPLPLNAKVPSLILVEPL